MRLLVLFVVAVFVGRASAAPVAGVCHLMDMHSHTIVPADLVLPHPVIGPAAANVTIDAAAGTIEMDGASVTVPPYPMPFSDAHDTFDFDDRVFRGAIDSGGNVTLNDFGYKFCTLGAPAGTVCVPGNLCSNDASMPCISGFVEDNLCPAGGLCQGLCANDPTRSCSIDNEATDCPGSYCGNGYAVPFRGDMTTGTATFQSDEGLVLTEQGTKLDFATGVLTLVRVGPSPPQTPIVGRDQPMSFFLKCALDPIPAQAELPRPPSWTASGRVILGKGGATVADDKLTLAGTFTGGATDFAADDLVIMLSAQGATVVSLRVPAGSLKANKRGTRFTLRDRNGVVQVTPPTGGKVTHKLTIKRTNTGYTLKLASKKLRLDALGAAQIETAVAFGIKEAAATTVTKPRGKTIAF
jgi:hypothetical protein